MSSSLSSPLTSTTKTILITGATDGIGRHTARKLATSGYSLLVHGRRPQVGAELTADLLSRGAEEVHYFNADLSDLDQVENFANDVKEKFDTIDILINNAGVFDPESPNSAQGYDTTWAVNVMAPFLLTRRLLPLIANSKSKYPRIITTSSISQASSLPNMKTLFQQNGSPQSGHAAYSNSKLGDFMLNLQLHNTLNACGDERLSRIKCFTMDPGTVNTKMLLAGWGACGIDVSRADNTYKLATEYGDKQQSGTSHFGGGGSAFAKQQQNLRDLWNALETHTGCTYNDIENGLA
eukprot:CAMPEP_0194408192 /NCGR_PEP_ID=MMETSP0176-20130528/6143_1 /TAXON_ID=216777 /ORGANISM="Proboscia alata, Strain PI-D3" /LENGTH=293 /DNA_ID=CAMNT_0039208201 /DNA_START=45 /DNA_END=926 /DNA_ORIENTATION=+